MVMASEATPKAMNREGGQDLLCAHFDFAASQEALARRKLGRCLMSHTKKRVSFSLTAFEEMP
jgi:hypothetical protein